jgi:ribosomal protein L37AE/L43A
LLSALVVSEQLPDLCEVIPTCPLCGGRMELVYDRPSTKVCVCVDCHSSFTVPAKAWAVAMARGKVPAPKPPET